MKNIVSWIILITYLASISVLPLKASTQQQFHINRSETNSDQAFSLVSSETNSWLMFHQNPRHTGYSPSQAPNAVSTPSWSYTTGGAIACSPAVADGKVFVGSYDHKIYALNELTGTLIWSYTTGSNVWSPAIADSKVFAGSSDCKIYALDESTGTLIWSYTTNSYVSHSSPAVADGKVFIGSQDHKVYALDEVTGAPAWSYTTGGPVLSSPAVADGKVFIGSQDGKIYSLDESTGTLIWSHSATAIPGSTVDSSPAVVDGKVFVGSQDNRVYALDESTGTLIWTYTTGSIIYISSPAVADGKVFIGSYDHKIYALNELTGTLVWSYTTGNVVYSSPAVADGKVFVGSNDHSIYALDESAGTLTWNYATGGNVYSPAIADGRVFVGSTDGKIYAFGEATPISDFSVTTSPESLSIQQGSYDTSTITTSSIGSFSQPVQLTIVGAPSGVTTTLTPQQVTPPAGGSIISTLTVSVPTTATPASCTLTVTGTNGALSHSAHISLEITATPPSGCGRPMLISPVQISSRAGYSVGDTLTARFTIQNQGTAAIHLDKLLLGGRFNYGGTLPGGGFPDFSYSSVTLQVGQTHQYEGTLYLTESGHYEFFVAYYIANPTEAEKQLLHLDPSNWNTCIDLAPGLTDSDRTWQRSISDSAPAPQTIPIAGKGIWTWRLTECEGGNIGLIVQNLVKANVHWVAIKCAEGSGTIAKDGYDYSTQWTSSIINQIRRAGIRFLGWQYVYGDDPIGEANVANSILNAGVDGFIIDAEAEYQGKPNSAVTYMGNIRAAHPNAFIAYAPDTRIDQHQTFPYIEFGKDCNAVMPQAYWKVLGFTPEQMVVYMENQWNKWNGIWANSGYSDSVKPIIPIGQGYEVTGSEITTFCGLIYTHQYCGVSLWRYDTMTKDDWDAYSGSFNPPITVTCRCPVNLVIRDPDGLTISKNLNEIPESLYSESDPNGNNDTVTEVSIFHRKVGDYFITVVPQPNASPNATYSLDFSTLNMTTTLAQNVSISDIPSESYAVTLTETTIVPRTAAHDIGIDRFSALKTIIGQDQVAGLDVKVLNYGDDVEHFNLTLYLNSSKIANLENITLASRDSFLTTFKWNTSGLPRGSYTINAVCSCVEGESYTDDNLKSFSIEITILGDVNGDHEVNILDVVKITSIYACSGINPEFSPNSDLNNDGHITILDVVLCTGHYGQKWP